jgi:hypothetical protein
MVRHRQAGFEFTMTRTCEAALKRKAPVDPGTMFRRRARYAGLAHVLGRPPPAAEQLAWFAMHQRLYSAALRSAFQDLKDAPPGMFDELEE